MMTRYFLRDETSTEVDPCILLWASDVDFDLNFAEMVSWLVSYREAAAPDRRVQKQGHKMISNHG